MLKLILPLFFGILFTGRISAECVHSGNIFQNGSSWNPDACSTCICQDPIAVCNRKRCTLSECDTKQGKQLIMLSGKCCPVCIEMRNYCQQDGQYFENDAVWDITPCMTCHCKWGSVSCISRKCPTVQCSPEETLHQFPFECCPKCIQTKNSCLHDGQYHPEGSNWNPIPCTKCFCQNSRVNCIPVQCPSLVCPTGEIELNNNECCPTCAASTCKHEGLIYQEGDSWQKTPCEVCSCVSGEILCIQNQCNNQLSCPQGQIAWNFRGECCPVCVDPSGQCDKISPARTNKEIWQTKGCEFCQCNRGHVQCQKGLCPRISCQKPFVKVHRENQCCPQCILPQDCEFNDIKYKSGKVWHPDACSLCSCNDGDVSCYQQTCTVCPQNTYHVPTESSCCGYCQPYKCAPECSECTPAQPNVCTKCDDSEQFVHNGKCLDECPDGYYGSSQKVCKKCHENCLSCSKGGPYYCSTCKSGLLYLEGQCVSQCPVGYHLKNWRCQACHWTCQTCIAPEMGQCLSCYLPGQLIFRGKCVDRCPPAMYIENKHCIACSQGCLKCSATSKKCLVCADGAILHDGNCLLSCPDGFYTAPDGIHCIACHPTCWKCDGGEEANCLSCHGGAQLKDGRCHLPCTPGNYRTYDGHCKACHDGCENCHLDSNGKDDNCINCTDSRETPSGSKCVSSCGASQYFQNGFCRDCATGCVRCTNEWSCQECQPSLVLSDGKCVTHCTSGEYVEVSKGRICNGCSPGCANCDDKFTCLNCLDGMFLKNNAECVEDCGPDYYSNPLKRLCEENSFAPEIRIVDQLLMNGTEEFGSLQDIIEVLDADTPEKDIMIYLVKPPENGNIVRIGNGKDDILSAKDSFPLTEMKNNRVIYVPGEEKIIKDVFVLKASDRQLFSREAVVHSIALPDGDLQLVRNKPFSVVAGQIISFNTKNVNFTAEVSPEDVTLSILTGPFHGNFVLSSHQEVKVFSLDSLQKGEVFYRHNGDNTTKDSFVLQAYDGYNVLNTIVDIHVRSKNSKKPILINNKMAYVKKGEMVKISSEFLKTLSGDRDHAKNGDIVYTLVPAHNNPQYGDLIMVVPALHDENKDEGWQIMDKKQMSIHLVRFLQRDIDEGRIWYKHRGGDKPLDKIQFEVADTNIPAHVLSHQEFQISVSASTELDSTKSKKISVLENQWLLLDSKMFASNETKTSARGNLLYTVVSSFHTGDGFLQHSDRPYQPVTTFTQEDVNNNRIRYKAPSVGSNEKEASFTYTVLDQWSKEKGHIERKFIVHVLPVAEKGGIRLKSTRPLLNTTQGGWVHLGSKVFSFSESDHLTPDLMVKLVKSPQHGKIQFKKGGKMMQMLEGEEMFYGDLRGNVFRYLHDGNAHTDRDSFVLGLADEVSEVKIFADVDVLPVEENMPFPVAESSQMLTLEEGEDVKITKDILGFRHKGSFSADTRIFLLSSSLHGKLFKSHQELVKGDEFTQRDVNRGYIRYKANKEIGAHMITEIIHFNISDGGKINILPYQPLALTILPVDNQAPELKISTPIMVSRGLQSIISTDNIEAIDIDTENSALDVVVHHQPNYGQIKMASKDMQTLKKVTAFPYEALVEGRVVYDQNLHIDAETTEDDITIYVTDGINQSPARDISVLFSDSPKESLVLVNEQVFVKEGHSVTLTNSSISVIGADHKPSEVIFKLDQPPLHGLLKKKRFYTDLSTEAEPFKKNDSFTYKDILGSLILYKHEGDKETTDSFTLSVTNGGFFEKIVMSVVIGLLHDETPRVAINDVLRIQKGSTETITSSFLMSTDYDSDDSRLIYKLIQMPDTGRLRLNRNGVIQQLGTQTPYNTFTQTDINNGHLEYSDVGTGEMGIAKVAFTVSDPQGNELLNQFFYISILDDRHPPFIDRNEELTLQEGGSAIITTEFLSASDTNVNSSLLKYTVTKQPEFGHIQLTSVPGVPISTFTQFDLISNKVKYVHTNPDEIHSDSFRFSVSDGQNNVSQKFSIRISPVDDSVPVVINNGLRVQEGIRRLITEFDLKAIDSDTNPEKIVFNVVDPTWHGLLQLKQQGAHHHSITNSFTMNDIYEKRLSYLHDGSESLMDHFKFTVNDGTNFLFSNQDEEGKISPSSPDPKKFEIRILTLDNGTPILKRNLGLPFLENSDYGAFGVISEKELKSFGPDTDNKNLIYMVVTPPKSGRLQNNDNPESLVSSFTQDDVNKDKILYILTGNSSVAEDHFVFDLKTNRRHIVPYNIFHISWSIINFEEPVFNISETGRVARIPLVRTGNLKQHSIVTCITIPGSATSMKSASHQGTYDFVQHSGQIQFDEWEDKKECVIIIHDDSVFEGEETFYVELRTSSNAIIGENSKVAISIYDLEDEPVIEFTQETFHVNETDAYLIAGLKRKGDLSQSVSVICSTSSMTATRSTGVQLRSGADFIGRDETNANRVVFLQDVAHSICPVKIIDDNIYEAAEHFELLLSDPSPGALLGSVSKALATIDGPNDESLIYFSKPLYVFNESAGIVDIDVFRSGSDQTRTSIVWCATRLSSPLSAMPQQDYVPMANQITFGPGQTIQKCQLEIIDDNVNPKLEGNETFEVFLSSAVGSNLHRPFSAVVSITDLTEDVAVVQFENDKYEVDEANSSISVPIIRSGDVGYESSVMCYSRQGTAEAGKDFTERMYHSSSIITFSPGEMTKNCTIFITDDAIFEKNESFTLHLSLPFGEKSLPAVFIGKKNNATIVITNMDDVPRVQFKEAAYSIVEPKEVNQINTLIVQVIRTGDIHQTFNIRCSTRDASAVSGLDYKATSRILYFKPGIKSIDFAVDILHNSDMEWHESFIILLEPEELFGAELGKIHSTTVTILDNKVSGNIVFPAPPIVVSLLHYDDVEKGLDVDPSPGYPLVCITPCDHHYPAYQTTNRLCQEAGINTTQISFKWEVSFPSQVEENAYQPFMELTENTLFTKVTSPVLDSVYFRSGFRLRCSAAPLDQDRNVGIRLKSHIVHISKTNSICHSPIYPGNPFSYEAQSFVASLKYTPISDPKHPNTIQISVNVPHQDGMLPLVSTMPLNNIKYLLSDVMYRHHHVCSNMAASPFVDSKENGGFFGFSPERDNRDSAFPYEFDEKLRSKQTLQLYRHLNLKRCTWTFRAWYHMTDLVDHCGGKILTNFKATDSGQSFLTVRVPLYVSYLYASAPVGWSSLEHHTEMQFSFSYHTVLWKAGREADDQLGGQLQVLRIAIGEEGHLVIDFRTQANFRGTYVLEHSSQPFMKSRLIPPDEMPISFDLSLLWSEQTYESPKQLWRATSQDSFKDYTGQYIIALLPCTVGPNQEYVPAQKPLNCTAHEPKRFQLPISFQQTNRPVPMRYSLNTRFQLTNKEELFNSDPRSLEAIGSSIEELDYNGAFSPGQKIYGRVLWNPDQDLSTAYKLSIKKVYLCTGKDGYIPTYDPTGRTYKEGLQFGCIQPNSNLEHRFLVLDREHEKMKIDSEDLEFGAKFVDEKSQYSRLKQMPGVDGFELPVDPLYKINSGHQWYLQVVYVIGPANSPSRVQRSAILTGNSLLKDGTLGNRNGTNMRMLLLDKQALPSRAADIISTIVPGIALFLLLLAIIAFILVRRHFKMTQGHHQGAPSSSSDQLKRISNIGGQHVRGTDV